MKTYDNARAAARQALYDIGGHYDQGDYDYASAQWIRARGRVVIESFR